MEKKEKNLKETYVDPKVLASYKKEDLEEIIRPHGQGECVGGACGTPDTNGGGGCGCGCGGGQIINQ